MNTITSISRTAFRRAFPLPFNVRSLDPFECASLKLDPRVSWWQLLSPFEFNSAVWGSILVPVDFITDFASVPTILQSIFQGDEPILLRPSAPHDWLFRPDAKGQRGWLPDRSHQLTLRQCNEVLREAMSDCGASAVECDTVFTAVQLANIGIRDQFAPPSAMEIMADKSISAMHYRTPFSLP